MYKTANKNNQKVSRINIAQLADITKFENLPPKEQRENYVLVYKRLLEVGKKPLTKEVRKELGAYQHIVQNKISAIRPKINGKPTTRDHFIDVAKETLPKYLYKEIMDKASERANEGRQAKPITILEKMVSLIE
jgi:rRNA pseudouridine-1189 N-methylase Emg1 (Nep1/Mra1 family)